MTGLVAELTDDMKFSFDTMVNLSLELYEKVVSDAALIVVAII